jgi:hypothetical protein
MPLSFQSKSHGQIAFGFFNIESDMLLLENRFFFAQDFCQWMIQLVQELEKGAGRFEYPVWEIENPRDIGDLMGAIHGIHFTGFIGEVYTHFPFPADPAEFKQNPEGDQTRPQMTALIEKWAVPRSLAIELETDGQANLGPFVFLKEEFWELLRYVWQGGYPRWKDQIRPVCVMKMKQAIQKSGHPCFNGVF